MAERRFDELTRLIAQGRSRREVLRLIAGGLVGGVAATSVVGSQVFAQDECAGDGESCEDMDCCEGYGCNADLTCEASGGGCGLEGESCEDQDCCEGLTCSDDLACVIPDEGEAAAEGTPSGTGGTTTTTAPSTGSGSANGDDDNAWLGITIAGGAAAIGAAAILRRRASAQTESGDVTPRQ
jgi:hypothetical protein